MENVKSFSVKKSEFTDWESVFLNSKAINIKTIRTGTLICKISGLINLNNINAIQVEDGLAKIPALAHIINHEKYGDYLIDTGFDSSFAKKIGGNFKGILKGIYFRNRYIQEKVSEGIEKQLEERSINLKGVFLTHIHEHAAGIPSLPKEIPYVFGNEKERKEFFH